MSAVKLDTHGMEQRLFLYYHDAYSIRVIFLYLQVRGVSVFTTHVETEGYRGGRCGALIVVDGPPWSPTVTH